jgi:predicted ATPase
VIGQPPTDGEAPGGIAGEAALDALARVLASETFAKAPVLRRLLDFLVDRTIRGRTDELKEYVLGVDVFDRGSTFDPRVDTIVRVQARRLRARLAEYYGGPGRDDPIVIDLPKGSYAVAFRAAPLPVPMPVDCHLPRIATAAGPAATLPRPMPLPAARTPLVGRLHDLAEVGRLLRRDDVRLLTLTGPGGSGKTRLALQAASEAAPAFAGGIYLIALASFSDAPAVEREIAHALGLRQTDGTSLDAALQRHLRAAVQEPTLLVLDNFEQLAPAAPALTALLDACAALKILVTSRVVLRVGGEHSYTVPPLSIPSAQGAASAAALASNPAVTLFVQRARAIEPAFELTDSNAAAVAGICVRLDGLPLALELAAPRIKVLTPAQLCGRLSSRLDVLTGGAADLPERQQTLRGTLDWSHALLTPAEQRMFRRLAVFAGGCTLEAIEAVCNTARDLAAPVLDLVSSLVDKNLIQPIASTGGERRFGMLETVREFAWEQLAASGETAAVKRAHAAYGLVVAEEVASHKTPAELAAWLTLCDAERENLLAALAYLTETRQTEWALRLAVSLYRFWDHREHLAEGRTWLEAVLALPAAAITSHRARALSYCAALVIQQGDLEVGPDAHLQALAAYRELGDRKGTIAQMNSMAVCERYRGNYEGARQWSVLTLDACREDGDRAAVAAALSNLADASGRLGDHAQARALLAEAAGIFDELDDGNSRAWCYNHLGDIALDCGDFAEAQRLYEEGIERFKRVGNSWGMARSACDLGHLACEERRFDRAREWFRRALTAFCELGHKRGIAGALDGLARLAVHEAEPARAVTIAGAAAGLRHGTGMVKRRDEDRKLERTFEGTAAQCDQALARRAWATGWHMPLDEAIRFALDGDSGRTAIESWSDPRAGGPLPPDPPGGRSSGRAAE